jgi:hypothetical protein
MLSYVTPGAMPGAEQRLKKTSSAIRTDGSNPPARGLQY